MPARLVAVAPASPPEGSPASSGPRRFRPGRSGAGGLSPLRRVVDRDVPAGGTTCPPSPRSAACEAESNRRAAACRCRRRSSHTSWTAPSTSTASGCRAGGRTRDAINEVRRRRDGFVWIGLHEPDEEQIQGIADTFGLHELAVEDAVHAHQRPKLDRYDETLFMVLKTVRYVEHESPTTANEIVETGEIMAFLGKRLHRHRPARQALRAAVAARGAGGGAGPAARSGPPRCCTPSPTASSTATWWSPSRSRTTST